MPGRFLLIVLKVLQAFGARRRTNVVFQLKEICERFISIFLPARRDVFHHAYRGARGERLRSGLSVETENDRWVWS
jgi:hypothetical protein